MNMVNSPFLDAHALFGRTPHLFGTHRRAPMGDGALKGKLYFIRRVGSDDSRSYWRTTVEKGTRDHRMLVSAETVVERAMRKPLEDEVCRCPDISPSGPALRRRTICQRRILFRCGLFPSGQHASVSKEQARPCGSFISMLLPA